MSAIESERRPSRGEFDGERDAVELSAERHPVSRIGAIKSEIGDV